VKRLLLVSLLLALVFGPLIAFADYVMRVHVATRYQPPLSQDEMQQWERGSVSELKAQLAKREIPYTKAQWLADSVGQRFFWTDLAKRSLVPSLGIFLACLFTGLFVRPPKSVKQ
jgi:hypothetical protein